MDLFNEPIEACLLVSQFLFIYLCRAIYNSKDRDYNARIMSIIIYIFYNMLSQAVGRGLT